MSSTAMQILLIEDDLNDLLICKRSMNKASGHYELLHAETLAQAVDQLGNAAFDVVLTDLTLPDARGLQVVHTLRKQMPSMPIIVLTTLEDLAVEAGALEAGAQDYLLKDEISSHSLERAIQHAVQRHLIVSQNESLLIELRENRDQLEQQQNLLKRKNKRLKRLYKTAHRFVDNVSHEFRTPLTVIKDYISLIREGLAGDVNDQQKQMLDVASVRVDDLNNMVDDMLDVSKLESGLLGAWRRDCHLIDIVEQVLPGLAQKATVKQIEFDKQIPAELPKVYCDADKVGRVIINLVTNAMKFCGDPGKVTLHAETNHEDQELIVSVSDNGAGIEESQLKLIFERFKQVKREIKSSTKGFGLGLNIAKELVDLNLGRMNVESEVGAGSTFSFTIPLANPSAVMERYTDRVRRRWKGTPRVSVLEATIAPEFSVTDAEDADSFFNFLLRQHDLLFRVGAHRWLIVLPTEPIELGRYIERAKQELDKANRNRPFGPLPAFDMTVKGTWRAKSELEPLLESFDSLLNSEPLELVTL